MKEKETAELVGVIEKNLRTCLETIFLRISQFFENEVSSDHLRSDLLEKMTVHIEGVRIPAVSESNQASLIELLKFRHFRRYYFEAEYDWDRLDFLVKKLDQAHPVVLADMDRFLSFLRAL